VQVPSTDGVSVAVHDLGGSGPPLVIAHATGFCGRVYEPLAAALGRAYHVWALDFRGHGESTVPSLDALHWHRITDDLAAAVAAVADGAPVPVFGHSMGGACALLLEHRQPGTFQWAYLYEPIVLPTMPEAGERPNVLAEGAARRRATFASRAEAMYRYAERPPLSGMRADCLRAYVEHGFADDPDGGGVTLRCPPMVESTVFRRSGDITLEHLVGITIPVTVATGLVTPDFGPASWGAIQSDALLLGRLECHDALGHLGPMQDPDAVAAAILRAAV